MKLESLKNDKFEPFKEKELQNAFRIIGGEWFDTRYGKNGEGCDSKNKDTDDGIHENGAGKGIDFKYLDCPTEETKPSLTPA